MRIRIRKPKNPDEPCRVYRNRIPGCVCDACNAVIELGALKTWERMSGRSKNYHMECAKAIGKLVNNGNGGNFVAVDEPEDDVDIDVPEVTPDPDPVAPPVPPVNGHVPVPPPPPPALPDWLQGMAQALLPYVEARINAKADKAEILALIEKHAVKREVIEIHDKPRDQIRVVEGHHHPQFKRLLENCEMGEHTMLVGPCASGKTSEIRAAAKALGYKLYLQGPAATKYDLLGYCDAAGIYHPTPFQQWFTSVEPALLAWDEYDGNESNAILDVNPALENRICNFPYSGEPVEMGNPKNVACAAANTWGLGATDDFVGRCRQDAAALDRWTQLPWDYDAEFERHIAGNDAWVTRVQTLRANARRKGLRVVISPRASIKGARKLAAGWPQAEVEALYVRKAMSDTDWRSIQ